MAVDLYSLLIGYAEKSGSPLVNIDEFQAFLKQYAEHFGSGMNEWNLWAKDTDAKFTEAVTTLIGAGLCDFHTRRKVRYVYLPKCAAALIQNAWKEAVEPGAELEEHAIAFPNELICGFSPPETYLTSLKVHELAAYLEKLREESSADNVKEAIIRIDFDGELRSVLLLSGALDYDLLCAALFRVRYYLYKNGNQEFVQQKLALNFRGREEYPKDILTKLAKTPKEVIVDISEGGDASYLLWKLCCELIRDDTGGKSSLSADDVITAQAIGIIEQYNFFYGKMEKARKNKKAALDDVLLCFDKAPYIYNLGQVINFTDANQTPLLSRYTQKELDNWLKANTTPTGPGMVPPLIAVTDKTRETWFIRKERVPAVCLRLLLDAQYLIKTAIIEQWEVLLEQYKREPSMDNDQAFESLLIRLLILLIPPLSAVLRCRLLSLIAFDDAHITESQREFRKLFNSSTGKLLNISSILFLKRGALVKEALERLPFWHSMPVVVKIITLFRDLRKKELPPEPPKVIETGNEAPLTFHAVCKKFEEELVPAGYTLDWYLVRLYQMWAKLLNESDRKNLLKDVNFMLRAYIRRQVMLIKPEQVDEYFLEENASNFIDSIPTLRHLHDNSLTLYVKLYILKTLRRTH